MKKQIKKQIKKYTNIHGNNEEEITEYNNKGLKIKEEFICDGEEIERIEMFYNDKGQIKERDEFIFDLESEKDDKELTIEVFDLELKKDGKTIFYTQNLPSVNNEKSKLVQTYYIYNEDNLLELKLKYDWDIKYTTAYEYDKENLTETITTYKGEELKFYSKVVKNFNVNGDNVDVINYYDSKHFLYKKETFTDNNLTKKLIINKSGGGMVTEHYYKDNKRISTVKVYYNKNICKIGSFINYEYNNAGRLILENDLKRKTTREYSYNENGDVTYVVKRIEGEIMYNIKYEYEYWEE